MSPETMPHLVYLVAFSQMDSRGKSLPVVGSSKCKAQGWERHLGELWFCDSHWLEWRCEIGLCQFTCLMTLDKSCNLSDYKLLPGISKDTWFIIHIPNSRGGPVLFIHSP